MSPGPGPHEGSQGRPMPPPSRCRRRIADGGGLDLNAPSPRQHHGHRCRATVTTEHHLSMQVPGRPGTRTTTLLKFIHSFFRYRWLYCATNNSTCRRAAGPVWVKGSRHRGTGTGTGVCWPTAGWEAPQTHRVVTRPTGEAVARQRLQRKHRVCVSFQYHRRHCRSRNTIIKCRCRFPRRHHSAGCCRHGLGCFPHPNGRISRPAGQPAVWQRS